MRWIVYTRPELIGRSRAAVSDEARAGSGTERDAALLLEGDWPPDVVFGSCQSLDERIDGRFDWIDRLAAEMAESVGATPYFAADSARIEGVSAAYLNNLALRYYLIKLIRPLAYLAEYDPVGPGDSLELVAAAWRDQDYADLFSRYCHQAGIACRVRWVEETAPADVAFPPNRRWRRWLARLAQRLQPSVGPRPLGRRVVLCGNPHILEPVAHELSARGCQLGWLVDRFAVTPAIRWRGQGIGQLVCNSSLGKENRLVNEVHGPLTCLGVDLTTTVQRWLAARSATHGPRQTRLVEQIDGHISRVRPEAVVLDEDATPMARAVVAIARRHGARSFVVQHGAPYCRFGFAPPSADRILAWGESSRRRLIDWGTPSERVRVTGSPRHEVVPAARTLSSTSSMSFLGRNKLESGAMPTLAVGMKDAGDVHHMPTTSVGMAPSMTAHDPEKDATPASRISQHRPPRVLLLATVAPRDDRPDAAALHLTTKTYARMLRAAVAVVAEVEGAELIVRPHPRAGDDKVLRSIVTRFPSLRVRWAERGRLSKWFAGVDCVLSCGSSAGVEATLAGLPVVQLAPPGASGFLPHASWGLSGTARNEPELRRLLTQLAADGWRGPSTPDPMVFAALGRQAAARTADEILAPCPGESKASASGESDDGAAKPSDFDGKRLAADGTSASIAHTRPTCRRPLNG